MEEHQLKWYSTFFFIISFLSCCKICHSLYLNLRSSSRPSVLWIIENKVIIMLHIFSLYFTLSIQPITCVLNKGFIGFVYFSYVMTICLYIVKMIAEQKKLYYIMKKQTVNIKNVLKLKAFTVFFISLWFIAIVVTVSLVKEDEYIFIISNSLICLCLFVSICINMLVKDVKSEKLNSDFEFMNSMFLFYFIIFISSVTDYLYGKFTILIIYTLCIISLPLFVCKHISSFSIKTNFSDEETYNSVIKGTNSKKLIGENEEIRKEFLEFCKTQHSFLIKTENEKKVTVDPMSVLRAVSLIDNLDYKKIDRKTFNDLILFICEYSNVYVSKNCYNTITELSREGKYEEAILIMKKDIISTLTNKYGKIFMIDEFVKTQYWLKIKSDIYPEYRYNDSVLDTLMEQKLQELSIFSLKESLLQTYNGYKNISTSSNDILIPEPEFIQEPEKEASIIDLED